MKLFSIIGNQGNFKDIFIMDRILFGSSIVKTG